MTAPELVHAPRVRFPLDGEWLALATPAEKVPSHGTDFFGQRYAYDFARIDGGPFRLCRQSRLKHAIGRIPAEAFFAWDAPVHAAFEGQVIRCGDGWPDRLQLNAITDTVRALLAKPPPRDDFRALTGNFVLIDGEPGVALYAHLRAGSMRVKNGDRLRAGDPIGRVGNSGNTTLPHLHFHLMSHADPFEAVGRPCGFADLEEFDFSGWRTLDSGIPQLGRAVRRCAPLADRRHAARTGVSP